MNECIMTPTLCGDPEYKQTSNSSVCKFNGAVNKRYVAKEGDPKADFFQFVAFGKTADFINKFFKKGDKMLVKGEVNNNNYTNKDGQKVYGTVFTIESVEFFGNKNDGGVKANTEAPATGGTDVEKSENVGEDFYDDF